MSSWFVIGRETQITTEGREKILIFYYALFNCWVFRNFVTSFWVLGLRNVFTQFLKCLDSWLEIFLQGIWAKFALAKERFFLILMKVTKWGARFEPKQIACLKKSPNLGTSPWKGPERWSPSGSFLLASPHNKRSFSTLAGKWSKWRDEGKKCLGENCQSRQPKIKFSPFPTRKDPKMGL